jgi:hypothetical protein
MHQLGTGICAEPDDLMGFVMDASDRVAMHAAAALPNELSVAVAGALERAVRSGEPRASAIAAGALAQHRRLDVLLDIASDWGPGRLWALRALGDFTPAEVEAAASGHISEPLRSLLEPIWVQHLDWLRTEENEGGLAILADQRLRFDPAHP